MHKLYKLSALDANIATLRVINSLTNQEVANQVGLRLYQVKYRVRKPAVRKYMNVLAKEAVNTEINRINTRLINPPASFVTNLIEQTQATTYLWISASNKMTIPKSKARLQASLKLSKLMGLTGSPAKTNIQMRGWINKYIKSLNDKLSKLKAS